MMKEIMKMHVAFNSQCFPSFHSFQTEYSKKEVGKEGEEEKAFG